MRLAAVLVLAAVAISAQDAIPKHPRELKFAARSFTPPKAASARHSLTSGATAYLVEDHQLPLVRISVTIRTGAYLEPKDKTGLAGVTGALMRSGGTTSKPPAQFDEEAAFLAANIGSSIGDASGSASLDCLAKDVDAGLALLADMMRNPGFDESRLKLAKSQILQGLERRNDSTASIEAREFPRLMRGPDHFTAAQTTKASIESITREDLAAFHQRTYFPSNFTFAVSGDFKTTEMLAKLNQHFGGWPSPRLAIPPPPAPTHVPKSGVYIVDKKEVNQGRVRIGHPGVDYTNPDHLALGLMNGILGGDAFSSRITARVRSDEGLAYSASSSFAPGSFYPGLFQAAFQSKTHTVAQAAALIVEEIRKLRDAPVQAAELAGAKAKALESLPERFDTAASTAGQFASDQYTRLAPDYWDKYTARIQAVTAADIQRVAKKYLQPDQLVILAVGNQEQLLKGNADRPQYSLEKLGKVTSLPLPDPLTMEYPK